MNQLLKNLPSWVTVKQELARRQLLRFTQETFPDYVAGRHHQILCSALDRFAAGQLKRLMVFMPPRHGKSELVSRRLPAYLLGKNPDCSIMSCSYGADLAARMNRDVQRIMESPHYIQLFPDSSLGVQTAGTNRKSRSLRNSDFFEIPNHSGCYRSTGVGGGITGLGFDFGIIDDPIKNREEADSPTVREAIWEWYTSTFYTRRSAQAGILLTMTRWNEDDLAGRLLKLSEENPKADQWEVIKFPAICEDPPGPGDWRQPGDPLWPERIPLEELEKTKAASLYDWHGLYQQNPRPEGGTEWPDSYFTPQIWFDEWPLDLTLKGIALDPSKGRDSKWGDYGAFVKMGRDKKGTLYVEADMGKWNTEQIVDRAIEHQLQFQPDVFAIETNQFQELLAVEIQRRAREVGFPLPIRPIVNTVNKNVRIRRLGAYLAPGHIRFKGNSPGTRLLVAQLRDFPLGQHDDGPDALEMVLRAMIDLFNERRGRGSKR